MKKLFKRIIPCLLLVLSLITILSCDQKDEYKYPSQVPLYTADGTFVQIGNLKVSKQDIYNRLIQSYGIEEFENIIDAELLKDIQLNDKQEKDFQEQMTNLIYGTTDLDELDAEEKAEAEKSFKVELMSNGLHNDESKKDDFKSFIVLDTETTGLSPKYKDKMVQVTAIKFVDFKPVEIFTTLLNPKIFIPSSVSKIHGITNEMVEFSPVFEEVKDAFSEFIKESFDSGYGLNMTAVKGGKRFRENGMFKRLEDARRFMIDWLDRNPDSSIEYFDICSGSNFSDPDGLEVWGGQGGYFYNVVNSSYKDHQQFTYREMSKIERSEVDINSYLGNK